MTRFLTTVVATAAAVLACSAAQAGYTSPLTAFMSGLGESVAPTDADLAALITKETAFKNLLKSGLLSEGFENIPAGALPSSSLLLNGVNVGFAGDGSVRVVNSAPGGCSVDPDTLVETCIPGASQGGRYSILPETTSHFYEGRVVPGGTSFSLSFDQAVAGFSFFGMDLGDFGGTVDVDLLDATGGVVQTFHLNSYLQGTLQGGALFFGVTSDASASDFFGVRFTGALNDTASQACALSPNSASCTDVFAFDRFTVATRADLAGSSPTSSSGSTSGTTSSGGGGGTVPEPLSLLLALGALGGAAVARRRRA